MTSNSKFPDQASLLSHLCAELERRLTVGESCCAEQYLEAYPNLFVDADKVLELIYTEYVTRSQLGELMNPELWYQRFPQWESDLRALFDVHDHLAVEDPSQEQTLSDRLGLIESSEGRFLSEDSDQENHFEILSEIGRGGMGVVYRGRDQRLGRDIAIKVLLDEHLQSPGTLRRFFEEARITGLLQHPGIPPIHDVGELLDGRPYFLMKLVGGKTLRRLLAERSEGTIGLSDLLPIYEQICQTLAYVHAQGVIHRDIKPDNVMVGDHGEVQVMDWGLAKILRDAAKDPREIEKPAVRDSHFAQEMLTGSEAKTQAGTTLGTPAYLAPEQAQGRLDEVDQRSDVFGLGALLCEILTGEPPYVGATLTDLLQQAREGELTNAYQRLQQCEADADLKALALSCLAVDPKDRPKDAGAIAAKLISHRTGVSDRLRQAELDKAKAQAKASAEQKARRLTIILAVAVILSLITVGGGWYWMREQEEWKTRATLAQAHELMSKGDREENALLRLKQAEGLLAQSDAPEVRALRATILKRIVRLQTEATQRQLRAKLGDLRLGRTKCAGKPEDYAQADREYARLFREHGMDVDERSPKQAAKQMIPPLRQDFAAFLVVWAKVRKFSNPSQPSRWKHLLAIANEADSSPSRRQIRNALLREDYREILQSRTSADLKEMQAPTLVLLTSALQQIGKTKEAIVVAREGLKHYPQDVYLNWLLGEELLKVHPPRTQEALRCFAIVVALRPTNANAYLNLGIGHLAADKDFESAIVALKKALQLRPQLLVAKRNLAKAYLGLGRLKEKNQEFEAAEMALKQAIRLREEYTPTAWFHLGNVHRYRNELPEAINAYRKVIEARNNDLGAHQNLGFLLLRTCQFESALTHFTKADDLASPTYRQQHKLSLRIAEAKKGLERQRKLERNEKPRDAYEMRSFARICYHHKKYLAAVRYHQQAFAEKPSLATNFWEANRYDAACAAVLLSAGDGDGKSLGTKERDNWRAQALKWLKAEMSSYEDKWSNGTQQERHTIQERVAHFLRDPDLASVRDSKFLSRLSKGEQSLWQRFWNRVKKLKNPRK